MSYPGGQLRRLTNDLSSYAGVSLTADRSSLVTTRSDVRHSIWVGDRIGATGAEMTALAPGPAWASLAWASGRLLHVTIANGDTSIAFLGARGGSDEIVTRGQFPAATSDGRTIVYVSDEPGESRGLWKVDADGRHAVHLVTGRVAWPLVTRDDKHVIFGSWRGGAQRMWSVPDRRGITRTTR